MEATKEKEKFLNGINVEQLYSTIDLIKENPNIAKFKFRAKTDGLEVHSIGRQ